MKRLERYSVTKNEEILPVLRLLHRLHLLSREDYNSIKGLMKGGNTIW